MTEDDRFEELLGRAAQDYNQPPPTVPREEMWAGIEARRQPQAQLRVVRGGAHRTSAVPRYVWWSAAAAAVVLVALGVGIGRLSTLGVPASGSGVASSAPATRAVAEKTVPVESAAGGSTSVREPVGSGAPTGSSATAPGETKIASDAGKRTTRARPGGLERAPSKNRSTSPGGALDQFGPNAYQVATIQHLADAEALLTSFRIESRSQKMDASLSTWARDLLSSTRLLLDSPAADDPRRVRLLQDLELVLAQIVQLSPDGAARERELIEGAIRDGHVMTRLRTAIPAGPARGL
jgi:hypothetical protein